MPGVVAGGSICAALFGLEDFVLRRNAGGVFRHLPFLPYFALRSVLYVGVIFVIIALVDWPSGQFLAVDSVDSLFSLMLVLGGLLLLSVSDLLVQACSSPSPQGVIMSRASRSGRSCSSTCAPRPLSPSGSANFAFLRFLNRFIADISLGDHRSRRRDPQIRRRRGDRDLAARPGRNGAACVRACFAALDRLGAQAPCLRARVRSRRRFPRRASLRPVAVGEIGSLKKEIALIGDTMNTAARILVDRTSGAF